jgi:predicted metal-dependent HD superfamily phosphohydrolase
MEDHRIMDKLAAHWNRCFADMNLPRPPPCAFEEIVSRYSEPHRAYHTVQHLDECFGWFDRVRDEMQAPGAVAYALLLHDAIYDTRSKDSEERSADLAIAVLEEYAEPRRVLTDEIRSLILATKHDAVPKPGDASLLVNIDLSILGADETRFDEYERQVRKEYGWVADADFAAGRAAILKHFLARPAIYSTAFFRDALEAAARANLTRSLRALGVTV